MINVGNTQRRLRVGTPIATVASIRIDKNNNAHLLPEAINQSSVINTVLKDDVLPSHDERMHAIAEMGISMNDCVLKGDELDEFSALLYRNLDVFAKNDSDIPGSDIIQHEFEMTTDRVINTKQFHQPPHLTEELKRQAKQMLAQGIIRRSNSNFNSPCFLVKRASGNSLRYVVDLRLINKHIVNQSESTINIEHVIEEMCYKKPKFFSHVDMKLGFWNLKLHERCKQYTAHTTPIGKMEFERYLCFACAWCTKKTSLYVSNTCLILCSCRPFLAPICS